MKKIFTLLMAWFLLASICAAQETPFVLSYCDGQVTTVATSDFVTSDKKVWVSGAIYIPAGQAKALAGNRLEKIRAGLATKSQIDSLRVWVRSSLNGQDLVSGLMTTTTTPALQKGWNEFTLDTPYVIPEDTEGFYIGYSFHQKSKAYGLSILLDPQPNALFVQYGSGEWTDYSNVGALCIEGFVYGDNMPQYDLQLDNISAGKYMSLKDPKLEVTCNIRNLALATINNYKAVCQFEGYDETITVDINQPIAYKERKQVKFTINPQTITSVPDGPVKLTVTLQDLDGNEDISPDNNTAQTTFLVVDNVFARNVLVEEFTTEVCPNCPRVANWMHSSMDKPEFSNVILWEHHSGYYTDSYTTTFDQNYMWFYNAGGSTYAPALMFDRFPQPAEQNKTPVTLPGTQAELEGLMSVRLDEPAFVNVNIKAGYQEDGKLKVIVTGERIQDGFTAKPPRMTVALVEDNLVSTNQSGASGAFTHHNVGRAVNAVWGEVIEWNGNNYHYECTFNVNSAWVKDNLAIIAFVSDYDSSNPTACEIANASLLRAADFGDITEPEPDYVLHYGLNEEGAEWQDVTFVAGEGENEGKLVAANVEFAANTEFKVNYGDVWYGGGTEDSYYLIHSEWFENIALDAEGKNFHINEAGTYTFVLDVTEEGIKMTVTGWPEPVEPDYVLHYGHEGVEWQDATFVPGEGENEGKLVVADLAFDANTEFGVKYGETWFAGLPNEGEDNYVIHYGWCTDIPLSTGDNVKNFIINEAGTYTFLLTVGEDGNSLTVNGFTAPALPGDANGDGQVDISDVNSVINQMLGKEAMIPACDMNGDGKIDISDVNAVINKMLGK